MSDATASANDAAVPYPYVSFATLTGLLDRLAKGPIPPRIDKSVLEMYSGGTIATLLSTLRTMGLINGDGSRKPELEAVILNEDARRAHFRAFVERMYPQQLALAQENGTSQQLLESFAAVKGTDTKRKAILFYLSAVQYAGLPTSSLFKAPKQAAASASARSRGKTTKLEPPADDDPPPAQPTPSGERVEVSFGELGTAVLLVDVQWLKLPDDTFTKLRSIVKDLVALGSFDGEDEDDS